MLIAAGIREADAFIALTQGDNRNLFASQLAKHLFRVETVVTRVYDPLRAELFADLGLRTFSPTRISGDPRLRLAVRGRLAVYIIIVGAGNVGYGLALELYGNTDYEVLLVERQRQRALLLREELGELAVEGDGTEVTFLERIGARRADLC